MMALLVERGDALGPASSWDMMFSVCRHESDLTDPPAAHTKIFPRALSEHEPPIQKPPDFLQMTLRVVRARLNREKLMLMKPQVGSEEEEKIKDIYRELGLQEIGFATGDFFP